MVASTSPVTCSWAWEWASYSPQYFVWLRAGSSGKPRGQRRQFLQPFPDRYWRLRGQYRRLSLKQPSKPLP